MGAAALEARPDGRLHIRLLGLEDNAAWLITTPGGKQVLLWDGRDSAISLPEALKTLPAGRRPLHLFIDTAVSPGDTPDIPTQSILPAHANLPTGTTIRLDSDVSLVRLPAPQDETPLFRLHYADFSMLLPLTNSQQGQDDLLASGVLTPVTVLVTPWPGTGAWPHHDLLTALQPRMILQPEGATYPPGIQAQLEAHQHRHIIPNDAMTEIVTDGRTFNLWQQSYSTDVSRQQR